ncbi:MAG: hypothetical protein ISR87_13225 [Candidatus Marinimicrobia bacterium]|nr:hypothetical protein [FCB group bacterium]MBL7026403.1 hypothetical protein [Candidatus Neomarinimicrobiota bacterium]
MIKSLIVGCIMGIGLLLPSQDLMAADGDSFPEIPENVSLESLKNIFQPVNFPHRDHAHMSAMGEGCVTCHHYAADEIYDPCADCHTNDPDDLNNGIPSLNAAYHRKCLNCHRGWSVSNVCGTCHVKQGEEKPVVLTIIDSTKSRIKYPRVVHYATPKADGPRVSYRHDQHVEMFRFKCVTCHTNERCATCHGAQEVPEILTGSSEIHHFPCSKCHDVNAVPGCEKCHREKASEGFTHALTTFPLKSFHATRSCTDCHDANTSVKKLDKTCTKCHENFELGSFDHEATGLVLELGHEEFECYECHLDEDFSKPPACYECHEDDLKYPEDLPGTRLD